MGHQISAFIGQYHSLQILATQLCHSHITALAQSYYLLPILVETLDTCHIATPSTFPAEYPEFDRLFPELIFLAQDAARQTPLAYVETDYFGGVGSQSAILWKTTNTYGPFRSETRYINNTFITTPEGEWAIKRVLYALGVQLLPNHDAFDTLGLGRFRSSEDWIERTNPA